VQKRRKRSFFGFSAADVGIEYYLFTFVPEIIVPELIIGPERIESHQKGQ